MWLSHKEKYILKKKWYILLLWPRLPPLAFFTGPDPSLSWGDGVGGQLMSRPDSYFFLLSAEDVRDSAKTLRIYHWKT